jgi:hypothetical protein
VGCSDRTPAPQRDQGILDAATDAQHADLRTDAPLADLPRSDGTPLCTPCTNPSCCTSSQTFCYGDPTKGIVCFCQGHWTCDAGNKSCQHPLMTPVNNLSWTCTWSPAEYRCVTKDAWSPPPGGIPGWSCTYEATSGEYRCKTPFPPNPCNKQAGVGPWGCKVTTKNLIVCTSPGTPPPPPCAATWSCGKESSGLERCLRTDATGLPPGGSGWVCHRATIKGLSSWICQGQAAAKPQGQGWSCVAASGGSYRCQRALDGCDGPPKATGNWICYMGSAFAGTRCEGVPLGGGCIPGQRRWCDGLVYGGWGQAECDSAGKWKMKTVNGKKMLDCQESLGAGQIPVTPCACYHFFFNPLCCQRDDCVLPMGNVGQTCPATAGGLCDPCNPLKPGCKEVGAQCLVTNAHETFCGRDCATKACPPDYTCMTVKLKVGTSKQCVPQDFSCYL